MYVVCNQDIPLIFFLGLKSKSGTPSGLFSQTLENSEDTVAALKTVGLSFLSTLVEC